MERALRRHRVGPGPMETVRERPLPLAAGELELVPGSDTGADAVPSINVIWGAFTDAVAAAGMAVGDVRRLFQRSHGIPPAVMARVNGARVEPTHRLTAGDTLEFLREFGEKGVV